MSPTLTLDRRLTAATFVSLTTVFGPSQFAGASPITASGPGRSTVARPAPASHTIKELRTSVDPATGVWTTAVEFGAPQSDADRTKFNVAIKPVGSDLIATWTGRTSPDDVGLAYNPISAPFAPGTAPVPESSFNAQRTVLTLKVTDPHIVGRAPDYVRGILTSRDGNSLLSEARAFLGPVAPRVSIPSIASHLVVSRSHVLKVPLAPVSEPSARRIYVYSHDGHRVGARTLGGTYYRRTSVTIRVTPTSLRHIGRAFQTGTLKVENRLENGSVATKSVGVHLRRR